ncbi:MAG: hydrogen peroxide-inducible genes activator [Azoarcus sp.]|nr:hydrogen peroxide-inducible genes activator [Azoarcus sp.]
MTLTDLRYLVALARERHFGRAAGKCHISQPTLSVALRKVEEELGLPLFERGAAGVEITETGRRVIAQAEKVLCEARRIHEIAAASKNPLIGPLRLGVTGDIGPYLLPHLIPRLHQRAPRMPLIIEEHSTARLAGRLRHGELEVIIASLPFEEKGIVTQPIHDEPFRILAPAAHPWAGRREITPGMLADEPLLLPGAGACFRDQVLEACPQCRGALQRAPEGGSLDVLRHMVASGLGVAVLPCTAADGLERRDPLVVVRPFADPAPSRRVALAWRVTYPRGEAIDLLRAAILDSALPGVSPLGPLRVRPPEMAE